jgi:hypothetical protein
MQAGIVMAVKSTVMLRTRRLFISAQIISVPLAGSLSPLSPDREGSTRDAARLGRPWGGVKADRRRPEGVG